MMKNKKKLMMRVALTVLRVSKRRAAKRTNASYVFALLLRNKVRCRAS